MTRVSGASRVGPSGNAVRSRRAAAGHFVVSAGEPLAPSLVSPVKFGGLIALQDESAPYGRDLSARREGEHALAALAVLQLALLDGTGPELDMLRDAVGRMTVPADPALQPLIGAIRLRARVELARYERI